jgi:hypothetical protein
VITKSGTGNFTALCGNVSATTCSTPTVFFAIKLASRTLCSNKISLASTLAAPSKERNYFFFTSYQGTRQRNGVDANCSSQINGPPLTEGRSPDAQAAL